ncbi:sensor histidine kinase [Streptomyces sp. NPDC059352]|uniref:sensor histidine kinase n=1 Tax=Streptomyces sp. NPDC059352 TaxID=3346810 RepID=UPI00368D3B86
MERHGDKRELSAISSAAPAPRIANVLVVVVFLGYLLMQAVNVLDAAPGTSELTACLAIPPLLAALQYVHFAPNLVHLRRRLFPWSLILQALITFVPFAFFGWHWGGMAGFLAGSFLLRLSPVPGWVLYGLTVTGVMVISANEQLRPVDIAYMGVSTALTGLVLYSMARLAMLATAIHDSRGELARMAVARERLRFARDLHDLLGYSLSSITLKNELIQRLITSNPQRACEEVSEVLVISRQALADVREVARGYRDMSLLVEAESAGSVLKAAGIRAEIEVDCTGLSSMANTILATVLREGVTNVLRHSQPRTCSITTSRDPEEKGFVRLQIVNDGVGQKGLVDSDSTGTGLANLAVRAAAVGGRLRSGVEAGSTTFRLVAAVPADAVAVQDGLALLTADTRTTESCPAEARTGEPRTGESRTGESLTAEARAAGVRTAGSAVSETRRSA